MTQESSGEQPASVPEGEPEARRPDEAGPEAGLSAQAESGARPPGGAEPGARRPAGDEHAPATGDTRVDDALASLAGLPEVPDAGHVEAFERVHQELQQILDEVGGQGRPGRGTGPGG